jgi:hypothetical protein
LWNGGFARNEKVLPPFLKKGHTRGNFGISDALLSYTSGIENDSGAKVF